LSEAFLPSNSTKCFHYRFLIDPVAKGRPRFSKHSIFTPAKTRIYERQLRELMAYHWQRTPLNEPIYLDVIFCIKKPKSVKRELPCVKPDGDNLLKAIKDAGNGILWKDDSLITQARYRKRYSDIGMVIVTFGLDSIEQEILA